MYQDLFKISLFLYRVGAISVYTLLDLYNVVKISNVCRARTLAFHHRLEDMLNNLYVNFEPPHAPHIGLIGLESGHTIFLPMPQLEGHQVQHVGQGVAKVWSSTKLG